MIAIVALLLGLLTQQPAALPYDLPPGWSRALDPQSGLTSLVPPRLGYGRMCVLTVFTPEQFAGSAAEFHDEIVRRATSQARQMEPPQHASVGRFLVTNIHQVMPNGFQMWSRIYTGRWADRGQAFILSANRPDLEQKYTGVADTMMSRIAVPQIAAAAAPPPAGPTPQLPPAVTSGDGLSGVYLTLKNKGGFNAGASKDFMVFFPNGRVFWHLPEEGLLDFDVARSQRDDANFWGSYDMHGDAVHISWATGNEYSGSRGQDGSLTLGGYTYVPVTSGADGRTLKATYRPYTRPNDPSMDVTFYPDGRFDDRGIRGYVGVLDLMYGRYKVPTQAGSGRYRIARNSIVFEYSDGRREQLSFYVPDGDNGSAPASLVINTMSVIKVR